MISRGKIVKIIYDSLKKMDKGELQVDVKDIDANSVLFGHGGILDSLSLITLIITIEFALEDEFDVYVELANDERTMSLKHNPFKTIDKMVDHIFKVLGVSEK